MLSRSLIFVSVLALGVIAPPQVQAQDPAAPGAPDDRAIELAFWNSVQAANECDAYKAYVTRYPDGIFIALARLAERRLCAQPAAAAAPAAPAADTPQAVQPAAQPAALAAPMPAEPPPQVEASAGSSNAGLVRAVQTELKRVNCGDMDATGEWNKETEDAVVRFNDHARWRFDWKQPSASLLSALVRSGEYACALECVDGYKADGGTCVPAADATPRPLPLPAVKRPRR